MVKMPRKEISSPLATYFGSEALANLLRIIVNKEGEWVQQSELAELADIDPRTVQRLFSRLQAHSKSLETDRPFQNVRVYKIKKGSNLVKALKLIIEDVEE